MLQPAKPAQADEPRYTEEQRFLDPATIKERFYGLKLSGTCLEPEFKDGELVVFDREAPVSNGCFANFFYRPEVVKPGHLSIALKKLVIAPPPFVTLPWQDNPASEVVPPALGRRNTRLIEVRNSCSL